MDCKPFLEDEMHNTYIITGGDYSETSNTICNGALGICCSL